jgi:hypothetical protein
MSNARFATMITVALLITTVGLGTLAGAPALIAALAIAALAMELAAVALLAGSIQTVLRLARALPLTVLVAATALVLLTTSVIVARNQVPVTVYLGTAVLTTTILIYAGTPGNKGTTELASPSGSPGGAAQTPAPIWSRRETHGAKEVQPRAANGGV